MNEMTVDINPARDVQSNAGAAAGQTNTHTHHATRATIMMVPPTIIMENVKIIHPKKSRKEGALFLLQSSWLSL